MNLQTYIQENLWLAIENTYQAGNYNHAILDAMHYLSDILREKSGVDGDGASLVSQALGGDSPRLRINRFQTETEHNQQKGTESILRGMYLAIRNPRSHEQIQDTQETADAIIYFLNYLLSLIEQSASPFELSNFLSRVFDKDFVKSQHYAELLIDEIPTNKRFDTLVEIYRKKLEGNIYNIGLVVHTLLNKLTEIQMKQYFEIISKELCTISSDEEIRYNIHLIPPNLWEQLSEIAALRIENKIIRVIQEGESNEERMINGALATWAREHLEFFRMREKVESTFIEKMESENIHSRLFVICNFFSKLPKVIQSPYQIRRSVKAISEEIRNENEIVRKIVINNVHLFPDIWQKQFSESLKDLTDENNPALFLIGGIPFLTSNSSDGDDNIPF